jgi:hypothetical protein
MAVPGTAKFEGGNARGSEMHQTSTKYCLAVARLTLTPINPLHHMIARHRVHDDLNVADFPK